MRGYRRTAVSEATRKAIDHLYRSQLDWGEFPIFRSGQSPRIAPAYSPSVLPTAYVLHALALLDGSPKVGEMRQKAVEFITAQRESTGLWRSFGRGSDMPPDLDASACACLALLENNVSVENSICGYLKDALDERLHLFRVWLGTPFPFENDVDCVVNANVLCMLGMQGAPSPWPDVARTLVRESFRLDTMNLHVRYPSALMFAYAVSRAFALGGVENLGATRVPIVEYLLFAQRSDGGWTGALSSALALNALISFGCAGPRVDHAVQFLLGCQDPLHGSWPEEIFCLPESGSTALTTSLCIEALARFSDR